MFRIVNNRKSTMINPKVSVTLALSKKNRDGDYVNDFYALNLEREYINYLPTTWTIVHQIEKESPLFQYSKEELIKDFETSRNIHNLKGQLEITVVNIQKFKEETGVLNNNL